MNFGFSSFTNPFGESKLGIGVAGLDLVCTKVRFTDVLLSSRQNKHCEGGLCPYSMPDAHGLHVASVQIPNRHEGVNQQPGTCPTPQGTSPNQMQISEMG